MRPLYRAAAPYRAGGTPPSIGGQLTRRAAAPCDLARAPSMAVHAPQLGRGSSPCRRSRTPTLHFHPTMAVATMLGAASGSAAGRQVSIRVLEVVSRGGEVLVEVVQAVVQAAHPSFPSAVLAPSSPHPPFPPTVLGRRARGGSRPRRTGGGARTDAATVTSRDQAACFRSEAGRCLTPG